MSSPDTGLTGAEARSRLARAGPNRLPSPTHRSAASVLLSIAAQPMVLLLLACTFLYALLGSAFDSAALAMSIVAVAAISAYQELRTQHVLEALRDLSSPRSTVVRDGTVQRIASQDLVPGDRLILQEGDRLACDATLVRSHSLRVDESMLTGESVPVDKDDTQPELPAARLHAGTLVVQGDGAATVTATGVHTALGRIGRFMAASPPRPSRLHRELVRLVRAVALLATLTCVFAAALFAWREGSWTAGLLVGLTLAMSIIPEEFAVVWTVMLALGAWRLAQSQVLTRQPQAIETLGTTTVLCVDKTGTLTCNRMEIAALHDGSSSVHCRAREAVPATWDALLQMAALASVREGIEPMDQAIFGKLRAPDLLQGVARLKTREGVAPGRPFMRQRWQVGGDDRDLVAVKGAPEAVLARCSGDAARHRQLAARADAWAQEGLRVIAVARARCPDGLDTPESGYEALGLVAFHDPLREDVPAALLACRQAGVRVVMVTGDAAATALAIARSAGLVPAGGGDAAADAEQEGSVISGTQLDAMDDAEFDRALARVAVFARVTPVQKLRIVQALQRRGEVVAMTGDGVNDGPALRAADVGVAMGRRGTDVAREAAALVLLDDRFASLVEAVRAGRRIFANLQKALGYLFAVHVPIVGLALLPLAGGPVLLLPLHVVVLELIIDPACSMVLEAEPLDAQGMRVGPRRPDARLFDLAAVTRALSVGGVALLAVVLSQWIGRRLGASDDALRLTGFATIVVGNVAMLQWFRASFRPGNGVNAVFEFLLLGICLVALVVLTVPQVAAAFGFPAAQDLRWALAALAVPAAWAGWRLAVASRRSQPA